MLGRLAGRPAAIVTFLDGMWIRRPSAGHCGAVGEALAELELIIRDWQGTPAAERATKMKSLIETVMKSGVMGDEFNEKMAWLCRDELAVIMKK